MSKQLNTILRDCVRTSLCLVALAATTSANAVPFLQYSFTPTTQLSVGWDINDVGHVVGQLTASSGFIGSAVWNAEAPILGATTTVLLPLEPGSHSIATAINNSDQVVGYSSKSGSDPRATIWNGTTPTALTTLGGTYSQAFDINNAGQITGISSANPTFNTPKATIWNGTTPTALNALPGGFDSFAFGINEGGKVAGSSQTVGGLYPATIWNGTTPTALGKLNGDSGNAVAINNLGIAVGHSYDFSPDIQRATLWSGTIPRDLGAAEGKTDSRATDINDAGLVVGSSFLSLGSNSVATLWRGVDATAIDLNTLLDANTKDAGWLLTDANAINEAGWITGSARNSVSGSQVAYVLKPNFLSLPFAVDDVTTLPGATSLLAPSVTTTGGIDVNKPTIVLTHGWQPTGDYNPAETPLPALRDSVLSALDNGDGTFKANIFTFQWEGAYSLDPWDPRAKVGEAGALLADELVERLGAEYTEEIHLVGHSFGTLVNSYAARALADEDAFKHKGTQVEQLTFLDAPMNDYRGVKLSPGTFYEVIPSGTVEYVDNFYGAFPLAFGSSLFGAAPDGGVLVPFVTHSSIHSQFYADRVQDSNGTWITAVVADRYAQRPAPVGWFSDGFLKTAIEVATEMADTGWNSVVNLTTEVKEITLEVADKIYTVVVDTSMTVLHKSEDISVTVTSIVGNTAISLIDLGAGAVEVIGSKVSSLLRLRESSPVVVAREVTVPLDASLLMFHVLFLNKGDGDWFTLYFDDHLLWSAEGANSADQFDAIVSLEELAGNTGTLYLTLNSRGERNADALIGDMRFVSYNPVPIPPSIFFALSGAASLALFGRNKRRNMSPKTTH